MFIGHSSVAALYAFVKKSEYCTINSENLLNCRGRQIKKEKKTESDHVKNT